MCRKKKTGVSFIAACICLILLLTSVSLIYRYYHKPDENGFSRIEIEAAKEVVMRYVLCLEENDREGAVQCRASANLDSLDYDMQWLRFMVYDLEYEPSSYAYQDRLKYMEQHAIDSKNCIYLVMDCELTTRYDSQVLTDYGWILLRESETEPWKIYDSGY